MKIQPKKLKKHLAILLIISTLSSKTFAQLSMVKDIQPGASSSFIAEHTQKLVVMNNKVYFSAFAGGTQGLYQSDGSTSGTFRISDLAENHFISELSTTGSFLGWSGENISASGNSPWSSDGVSTINYLGHNVFCQSLFPWQNEIYYAGHTFDEGFELWKTNGTSAGTVTVKSLPGVGVAGTLTPSNFVAHSDGLLYFLSWAQNFTCSLWRTNGTTAGTIKIKDVPYAQNLISVGSNLYFTALNYPESEKLWISNGTMAGTVILKDINPTTGFPEISSLTAFNNKLYFKANDGTHGFELWESDGTTVGTIIKADINLSGSSNATPIGELGTTLFLRANDGINGSALWKLDGLTGTVSMVKDINAASDIDGYIEKGVAFSGKFYFPADNVTNGIELWRTDGTLVGTELVGDINPTDGSYPRYLTVLGKRLLFVAFDYQEDFNYNFELWKYEDPTNLPCTNDLVLNGTATDFLYEANHTITSTQIIPQRATYTTYKAQSIILNAGFLADKGTKFKTISEGCQ